MSIPSSSAFVEATATSSSSASCLSSSRRSSARYPARYAFTRERSSESRSRRGGQVAAGELGEELGRAPRAREPDRLHSRLGQARHQERRVRERAAPSAGLLVYHRRGSKGEGLSTARRRGGGGPGVPWVAPAPPPRGDPP